MSDAGGNFVSERYKELCRNLNIQQAVSSSYCHQSNRQVDTYIKFIKLTLMKCFQTNADINLGLLQIRTVVDKGDYNHNDQSYRTCMMKT